MNKTKLRWVAITSAILSLLFVITTFLQSTSVNSTGFLSSGLVSVVLNLIVGIPFYIIYFLSSFLNFGGDSYGFALLIGTLAEFVGPIFIFIFWFIVLWAVSYLYNKFIKRNQILTENTIPAKKFSTKATIILCVIFVVVINFIPLGYLYHQSAQISNQYQSEENQIESNYEQSYQGTNFSIPELGVQFKLPSQLNGFYYTVIENDPTRTVVGFSTNQLAAYDGCAASNTPLGVLVMYPHSSASEIEKITGFLVLDAPREYDMSMVNGGSYHPYSPYTIGSAYYFYDDPFETTDNPSNPTYKYYQHPEGYLGYLGSCSTNSVAIGIQNSDLGILKPALSTITKI